jgi:acetyltransferase
MADNAAEAEKAAAEIGFPVVVKVDSESLIHKSDKGGVALNLKNGGSVRSAVKKMEKRFKEKELKFLVQKCLPEGREIIVGAKAEEGLGHLIMLGMGGVYVEVFKDTAFKLAPVTGDEAQEMLSSLKAASTLNAVNGKGGIDRNGIVEIVQRISQLVAELPEIQEMDINPVIAYEDSVCIADARVIL